MRLAEPHSASSALPSVGAYAPRPIRPLGVWQAHGWRLKEYAIAATPREPSRALLDAAREHARATLPRPAVAADRYGVGYVGIHECDGTDYAFFGWWARGNELYHHLLSCPSGRPGELASLTRADTGLVGCVWELEVVRFERNAWVRYGMRGGTPDVEGYLAARLEGCV
jgi:hypothetical protein